MVYVGRIRAKRVRVGRIIGLVKVLGSKSKVKVK